MQVIHDIDDGDGLVDFGEFRTIVQHLESERSALSMVDGKRKSAGVQEISFAHYEKLHARVSVAAAAPWPCPAGMR
jgi:hypothetical protein|eukprot:SAG25_NODE_3552_length_1043_cov_23.381356_2_plen_76_part_00